MSVGDIASDAKGSGARFNDGKPDLSLIPLRTIAESLADSDMTPDRVAVRHSLAALGMFQETGDHRYLRSALWHLRDHWRDCARVFEYGKKKYAEWNWAKGMAWSIPIACAGRHALAYLEGEELDPESGLDHRGHFMCNLVMLYTFIDAFPQGNDLPDPLLFVPF